MRLLVLQTETGQLWSPQGAPSTQPGAPSLPASALLQSSSSKRLNHSFSETLPHRNLAESHLHVKLQKWTYLRESDAQQPAGQGKMFPVNYLSTQATTPGNKQMRFAGRRGRHICTVTTNLGLRNRDIKGLSRWKPMNAFYFLACVSQYFIKVHCTMFGVK